ncbi:MAG TPA: hypothetical protein VK255_01820 [Patescibacteria group bacterium]|nr:hypothetical protein [Patescibacteria group bacterium]
MKNRRKENLLIRFKSDLNSAGFLPDYFSNLMRDKIKKEKVSDFWLKETSKRINRIKKIIDAGV